MTRLKIKLLEKDIMIKNLADKCGVTSYIMGQKIKYNNRLKLPEIKIILKELNSTFEEIFIDDNNENDFEVEL